MAAYALRRDLYRYGLPRGLGMLGRLASSAKASTDVVELDGHGFETDDPVVVRATDGGSLPAPLVSDNTYYAIRLNDSRFKLAATAGGAAIDLTTDGVSVVVAGALPMDEVLEFYSRWVDGFLPAHFVPLTAPYPVVATAIVAELAAKKLLQLSGQSSESVDAYEKVAMAQLERWAKGLPLRDAAAPSGATKAVTSTVVGGTDSRGWGSETLP